MRRLALLIGLVLTGCGSGGDSAGRLPAACSEGPDSILRALTRAPAAVRLGDGTRLSECVERAFSNGEVQELGFALTPAADRLAARRTTGAALQLGYLVGAVRRGASQTNGIHSELVRRMEATVVFSDRALLDAAQRGASAGEVRG